MLPIIITVANEVLTAVGLFLVYKKMNVKRWKAFIPLFNTYPIYKELWEVRYFWMWLLADAVIVMNQFSSEGFFSKFIFMLAGVTAVVLELKMYGKLAESFGYYIGMA